MGEGELSVVGRGSCPIVRSLGVVQDGSTAARC